MGVQSKSIEKLLVSKDKISVAAAAITPVVGGSILGSATKTIEIFDERGTSVGWLPIFDTVDLT